MFSEQCVQLFYFKFYVFLIRLGNLSSPFARARRIFQSMMKLSIEELCETAESLIAPVRLGVARPTAPFTLSTNSNPDIQVCIINM